MKRSCARRIIKGKGSGGVRVEHSKNRTREGGSGEGTKVGLFARREGEREQICKLWLGEIPGNLGVVPVKGGNFESDFTSNLWYSIESEAAIFYRGTIDSGSSS